MLQSGGKPFGNLAIEITLSIRNYHGRKKIKCCEHTPKEQLRAANFHFFFVFV